MLVLIKQLGADFSETLALCLDQSVVCLELVVEAEQAVNGLLFDFLRFFTLDAE